MIIIAIEDEELALAALLDAIRTAAPDAELHGFSDAESALAFLEESSCDAAFLDVRLPGMDGVTLAEQMLRKAPGLNLIFSTGFEEYRSAAFDLHASGYLTKPITPEKVRRELADLRHPVAQRPRIRVQAFGSFEVYLDGRPLPFKYRRTRELLAYLVDRRGALCSNKELLAVLFEDDSGHETYLKSLRRDLLETLDAIGCSQMIARQRGQLGVVPGTFACDYYDWCEGGAPGSYRGEYMTQYSWGESTNSTLKSKSH